MYYPGNINVCLTPENSEPDSLSDETYCRMISNEFRPQSLRTAPRLQPLKRVLVKNHLPFFTNLTTSQFLIISFRVLIEDHFLSSCLINGILFSFHLLLSQKGYFQRNQASPSFYYLESRVFNNTSFKTGLNLRFEDVVALGDCGSETVEKISEFETGKVGLLVDLSSGRYVLWTAGENSLGMEDVASAVGQMISSFDSGLKRKLGEVRERVSRGGILPVSNFVFKA